MTEALIVKTTLLEIILIATLNGAPHVAAMSPPQTTEVGISIPQISTVKMEPIKQMDIKPMEELAPIPVAPVVDTTPKADSEGNTYTPGNCTWYAKSRRPDLPNNLGNADTWTYRAANQGIATGNTPRAGAVGQLGMHVVYVESVNGDEMTISEMNYQGLYIISGRTLPWQGWSFIY